ncbi:hypothetical protein GQR58_006893 [Nymphon striatum]|nr:hypothetical protein GQR58_006893 [Nymphon striatum]
MNLDIILELESTSTEPDPNTGADGENLQPITPLTNSETSIIPNVAGIPNVSSLTVTAESGFDGSLDQDLHLIEGVTAINAVDIQRDIGISVICDGGATQPVSLNAADFSTGNIDETFYDNGQQVASCRSSYASILPIALTSSTLFDGVLEDWGTDMQLSTNCPTGSSTTTPPSLSENTCTSIVVENYLITDANGVEHKVSKRITTVPNE